MLHYLITKHSRPKFYNTNADVVDVPLTYVDSKIYRSIDEHGKLHALQVGGQPVIENHWLVENIDNAMATLAEHDVFPFESKAAARVFAKNNGLSQHVKYLPVGF
ncbi:hypothetical protein VA249_45940 (plasmid) [Vibrio alfacsensis]|uniref:hypothetical protein n=1 Tax=Vibrio alfacsensis TaxID=1074311 RepID=UPI001BF17A3F|nr:hypothetical protein [Vibrio alfacsensis]BBM67948.1 hypothetical protein VA249_45940 [Vibrio alfacsensis]